MHKKGAGNDKQGKDAGNRTLCPYRNFSQTINSKYQHHKMLLLLGLQLPFDNTAIYSIDRFVAVAVRKIYKIHTESCVIWGLHG